MRDEEHRGVHMEHYTCLNHYITCSSIGDDLPSVNGGISQRKVVVQGLSHMTQTTKKPLDRYSYQSVL